jgi:hypothetical protein
LAKTSFFLVSECLPVTWFYLSSGAQGDVAHGNFVYINERRKKDKGEKQSSSHRKISSLESEIFGPDQKA